MLRDLQEQDVPVNPSSSSGKRSNESRGRNQSKHNGAKPLHVRGAALPHEPWLERKSSWLVLGFTGFFTLFLLLMNSAGQVPGQSFLLKSLSDIFQFVGEAIGLVFCLRLTHRLHRTWRQMRYEMKHNAGTTTIDQSDIHTAKRVCLAWSLLTLGIALYTSGQAIWTSYDVRMPSFQVPFPGLYDVGFVGAYPFLLVGTLLLTRKNRAAVGRTRLILDSLSVIGAALALSWFFLLGPTIAKFSGSIGADVLSVYFPAHDLFLVAVVTLLMFSPLASREQQSMFVRLCAGLLSLAITDTLLGFLSLSPAGFNTGTLQDMLWPLSMQLIGLAAVEYSRSVAREQEKHSRTVEPSSLLTSGHVSRELMLLQTIAPFVLSLTASTVLLTVITPHGGAIAVQSSLSALALIVIVIIRQALTVVENTWLRMQIQGELIVSQHALAGKQLEAMTDAITGLPNHRAVMSRIDEELARCTRTQVPCAILFLDLDHFKRVNDTWGHRAGDAVLREVASRLRHVLRLEDCVGRYGGEEFAIVLTDSDIEDARQTAERLRCAISAEPCIWQADDEASPISIAITVSIGLATSTFHGMTREQLVERADHAMYRAKQSGRNRVCIADLKEGISSSASVPLPRETIAATAEMAAVQVLTAVASVHDRGIYEHAQRMVVLAEATARVLNQSEEAIRLVRLGALLHDIGKMGIPDAILHKPGSLTNEEWMVMRKHPIIGQYILFQAGGVLNALADIVVAHHERWDGTGYPMRLSGEAIPLGARILSVIDSYDAMISQRSYKQPISVADARAELERCAGSQYDPRVVVAFLKVLDEEHTAQVGMSEDTLFTSPEIISYADHMHALL